MCFPNYEFIEQIQWILVKKATLKGPIVKNIQQATIFLKLPHLLYKHKFTASQEPHPSLSIKFFKLLGDSFQLGRRNLAILKGGGGSEMPPGQ